MASSSLVVRPSCVPIMNELLDAGSCGPKESSSSSRCVAPWLMLPPVFDEDGTLLKFYRLGRGDVVQVLAEQQQEEQQQEDPICLGSLSKGWLVCIQPKNCYLFMFNPLSGMTLPLPSFETFPCVKGVLRDPLSGLVEKVLDHDSCPITPQQMSKYIVSKMVLTSPDPMDEDCIAMVIYGADHRLAFCRRPAKADSWTALDGPLSFYDQIVFHSEKKLFFAFTHHKQLEAWDLHHGPIKRFLIHNEDFDFDSWPCPAVDDAELERKSCYCWDIDYLVYDHQSHELFIVTRYAAHGVTKDGTLVLAADNVEAQHPYKTQTFDVFRLDFIDNDHVDLQYLEGNLGNRAFFVGSNPGFALSTTMFPELRPNSIYFTDDFTQCHRFRRNCGGHDLGIYDYKEQSFLPCYYPIDVDKIQRILPAPIWFTPGPDVDATCLASTLGL